MKLTKEQLLDAVHQLSCCVNEHGGSGGGGTVISGSGTLKPWVYDTSGKEQVIGVYDGKPLYRKAFTIYITCAANSSVSYKISDYIDNCESILTTLCYNKSMGITLPYIHMHNSTSNRAYNVWLGGDSLTFSCAASTSNNVPYLFIFEYTKTTDAEGSGNKFSPCIPSASYSYEEQIVGTWVDGTPLYQKTINIGALPADTSWASYEHGISDVATIFTIDCFGINASSGSSVSIPNAGNSTASNFSVWVDRTKVEVWNGSNRSSFSGYITLRYTKTTDALAASLTVNGSTEALELAVGDSVTLSVTASGGTGVYEYKYVLYNVDKGTWWTLKDYCSESSYTGPLTVAGTKYFVASVRDSAGTIVSTSRITVIATE